ncbi:MAG: type II toxin-antitoxin system PemK/MazF family toxin, partial [Caldisericia bacterium]|nr:type II toxin-antitoxin system PemK/MazF family toxin [Caldisericia bacterium]
NLDFYPQKGHEQNGKRPALIISNESYHRYTNLAVVCPITNTNNGFPMHISLADHTSTTGFILCEHLKSMDLKARKATFVESINSDLLDEVLERVALIFVK